MTFADPAERSALLGAAGILRVFLGELFKIRPALELLEEIFRTALRFGGALLVDFTVGSGEWGFDQNVANLDLFGNAIFFAMLVVVSANVVLRDLKSVFSLRGFDQRVLHFALFGDRVGEACLVALVVSLQLFVGWMQDLS